MEESMKGYVVVSEGKYSGVQYKINDIKVENKDGKDCISFDYDCLGVIGNDYNGFEVYLSDQINHALEAMIEQDGLDGLE